MDGIHDLGGRQGFGAVPRGPEAEASFHEDWQRRVFGLALAGRDANVDAFRHAIERVEPADYLTVGYWGRWLDALERLTAEADPSLRSTSPLARREVDREPLFALGDPVRVRRRFPSGHTRLPGYARGRHGTIVGSRGVWVYPDTNAHGLGEDPKHVYGVRFESRELWGEGAEPGGGAVYLDLFEPYLEAVGEGEPA